MILAFWCGIAVLSAAGICFIWPEPYEFSVSQITFDAWELRDGQYVQLDHYNTGYAKLEVFKRQLITVVLFSGIIGACLGHIFSLLVLLRLRDMSWLSVACAIWGCLFWNLDCR